MKAYGVNVVEFPDVADIVGMGAKSSAGRVGSLRGYCRTAGKAKTRRRQRKAARRSSKAAVAASIGE